MKRKKIRTECDFIGLKNYRCKKCNGTLNMSINDLFEIFQTHIGFAMAILINLFCY